MNGYSAALDPNIIYKIRKMESLLGRKLSPEEMGQLTKGSLATQAQRRLAGESVVTTEAAGEKKLELGGRELELYKERLETERLANKISGVSGLATLGLTGKMLGKELGLWGGAKAIGAEAIEGGIPSIGESLVSSATGVESVVAPLAISETAAPVVAATAETAATTAATAGTAIAPFILPVAIGAGIALLFKKLFG